MYLKNEVKMSEQEPNVGKVKLEPRIFKTEYNNKSRIVIVENVYHQSPNEDPIVVESRFDRWLSTNEQPFIRKMYVEQEWKPLDYGWINNASILVITNEKDKSIAVRPTHSQQELLNNRILEVGIIPTIEDKPRDMHSPKLDNTPIIFTTIPPGESIRINPPNVKSVVIRCQGIGVTRCTISLFSA
jgi:hypothetical protein